MHVVAVVAMLVAVTGALPGMGPPGMMPGMFPPMGAPRRPPMMEMDDNEGFGRILTCQLNFRDAYDPSKILNSIAINIKEKPQNIAESLKMSSLMNHGEDKPGLEANIGVFSTTGGRVTIAITETARPQDGCEATSFGDFIKAKKPRSQGMGGMGGYSGGYSKGFGMGSMGMGMGGMGMGMGMPGFGSTSIKSSSHGPFGSSGFRKHSSGFGMGGGYGMGGSYAMKGSYGMGGGFPMGSGFGMGSSGFGMGGGFGMGSPMMSGLGLHGLHRESGEAAGSLATTDLAPGIKASIVIDKLKGFESLDELAGRGVVVCPAENIDHDFDDNSRCDGGILACCALHYDTQEVVLGGNMHEALGNRGSSYTHSSYGAPKSSGPSHHGGYGNAAPAAPRAPAPAQGYGAPARAPAPAPGYGAPAQAPVHPAPSRDPFSNPTTKSGYP